MLRKENKGITLVALVITIIILLILAGISISTLTNTGIFGKAKDAQSKSALAEAKEKMTLLLNEWQMDHVTSTKTLNDFLQEKYKDGTISQFYQLDNGNYELEINGYVGVIDEEGNIVEEMQKAGPRPQISNITIKSEDGSTDVADNSQKAGTKLQINFSSSIEKGTIKSVTPAVPYTTNGTETEVTFTIVGTVDGTDYTTKTTVPVAGKYKVSTPVNASAIASATDTEKATNYYGKSVNYTSANGVTGWKIFYAGKMSDATDAPNNIYLIADDYVDVAKLPKGTNEAGQSVGSAPTNTNSLYPKAAPFTNVMSNYLGASRITTDTIRNLNKSFFARSDANANTNDNMKAVAYMLDTTAWNTFKDNNGKAEYAIGGPTLEMLFNSYNQKHPGKNYEAQATNATGYQLRIDGGKWIESIKSSSDYLDSGDSLYVLPSSKGANAMWVASTSAHSANYVMFVNRYGNVIYNYFSNTDIGFRPIVCLKSNAQLQESGDGFSIK